jgi:FMN phosphatase YigB (HAD superfamily)|tara:strand:+ start:86 stop:550 length:465 start_codon:yes stop_codon:yes gene_type:complete
MIKKDDMKKIVIFDLDGTLALIDKRRDLSTKDNGKFDWDVFFDPKNIDLDLPNQPVIDTVDLLSTDYRIWILSGRSDVTHQATRDWLSKNGVYYDNLVMRPQNHLYLPDNELKQMWLDSIGVDNVAMVFDDRNQVVDMWRQNGLTCFQVADGDF